MSRAAAETVTSPRHQDGQDFITVSEVSRRFRSKGRADTVALSGIHLTVTRGQFVSLIGPSGCGKSTLLSMIAGSDKPTSGEVRVGGSPVTAPLPNAGVVFQSDLLLEWRTCLDNVLLQLKLRGRLDEAGRAYARELLAMVGVEQFEQHLPRQLSGGMRQRVAICRALVHDPDLLLMDEPFGALDAITREQINADLARIVSESSKTVVFVTHSIDEAVFLSDRVIVMTARPGRLAADIAIDLPRPRNAEVLQQREFLDMVAHVRGELVRSGAYRR